MTERQTEYETETEGISDKEFAELKSDIRAAWDKYDALQKVYRAQTGVEYRWFK